MNPPTPPPLPVAAPVVVSSEKPHVTYLQGIAMVLPSMFFLIFTNVFLLPKFKWIWHRAGLENSKTQWLLDGAVLLTRYGKFLLPLGLVLFVILERTGNFSSKRRNAVFTLGLVFQTLVLLLLASLATGAMLAVPLLTRGPK